MINFCDLSARSSIFSLKCDIIDSDSLCSSSCSPIAAEFHSTCHMFSCFSPSFQKHYLKNSNTHQQAINIDMFHGLRNQKCNSFFKIFYLIRSMCLYFMFLFSILEKSRWIFIWLIFFRFRINADDQVRGGGRRCGGKDVSAHLLHNQQIPLWIRPDRIRQLCG